jgi:hypothetical protein
MTDTNRWTGSSISGMGRRVSGCAIKLCSSQSLAGQLSCSPTYFVIRSSMDRSSRMNVGRVIRDRSAPGRSWAMICDNTSSVISCGSSQTIRVVYHCFVQVRRRSPLDHSREVRRLMSGHLETVQLKSCGRIDTTHFSKNRCAAAELSQCDASF